MHSNIFTVIVTYKRAALLRKCLQAIIFESEVIPSRILIVVNNSDLKTLDTIHYFQRESEIQIEYRIFENSGPAGGFHFGLKEFLTSNSDAVWLMDDDIIPNTDCLKILKAELEIDSYVFPKVISENGHIIRGFGWWGVLISRIAVKKAGLPLKEFFYWAEDTEYLQNRLIRKNRIIPRKSQNATVIHVHQRNALRPDWYYYYTIRNYLYYRSRIFPLNFKGSIRILNMFAGLIYRIGFRENNKVIKFKMVLLGTKDGLKGKLGKVEEFHIED